MRRCDLTRIILFGLSICCLTSVGEKKEKKKNYRGHKEEEIWELSHDKKNSQTASR